MRRSAGEDGLTGFHVGIVMVELSVQLLLHSVRMAFIELYKRWVATPSFETSYPTAFTNAIILLERN